MTAWIPEQNYRDYLSVSLKAKYHQKTSPNPTVSIDLVAFHGERLKTICSIWQNGGWRTHDMTVFADSKEPDLLDCLGSSITPLVTHSTLPKPQFERGMTVYLASPTTSPPHLFAPHSPLTQHRSRPDFPNKQLSSSIILELKFSIQTDDHSGTIYFALFGWVTQDCPCRSCSHRPRRIS